MKALFQVVLSIGTLWLTCVPASAQQDAQPSSLTLQQAVTIALEKNPLRKAAIADAKAASAGVHEARSFLMPHLSFSETATRGDDPIYVFGTKLRQSRFTNADFALNKLNTPLPFGNFSTRFGGTWNLFDSFATWHGINQAKQINEAVGHQLDRTDQEIVFRVVSSFYDVLLAAKELEVAEQSAKSAQSIMDRSQARFDSGLTVESDLLTAKVRMAGRQQEVIRARNTLEVARAQLNTAMGMPLDFPFQVTGALAERMLSIPALQDVEKQALTNRPDLKRIASEEAAQRQSVSIAKSAFGPRVNAFAGWEMDNPTFVAGGGGNNWLGGIEVQFDIFQGGAKRAELSKQRALEEKVVAMKQAAGDAVRLEVRRAYYETDASRQQIEVARAAIAQAQESLRINQDRYDSGLTTITDLLGAEDAARRSQTDYWEAVCHFQTSYANLELASGSLNPQSAVVMP
ncbi:MAG TPA: TolC family protein [Terriglobales bacterium]|nr:TolC family protein [Terriglobales bacterium]